MNDQRVGPSWGGTGTTPQFTAGISGASRIADAHPRFLTAALEGRLFSDGVGLTAINNATYTTATLGATATPVIGVYNPIGSAVNLVIIQANLGVVVTAGTATGPGSFAWAAGITTVAISTGSTPFNRRTLQAVGSSAKGMSNVALTGLTPNLVVRFGSALTGGNLKNISAVETAVGQSIGQGGVSVENFDGSLVVPPGGVLALLATTTPVAHSVVSGLLWEEVPILP